MMDMAVHVKATLSILWLSYAIVYGSSVCRLYQDNKATCMLKTHSDFSRVKMLPNTTKELHLLFSHSAPNLTDLHLHSLAQLEILSLQPSHIRTSSCFTSITFDSIINPFRGLNTLKQLSINLCTDYISPSIFQDLRKLEVLDFAYTFRLNGEKIADILDYINRARYPIKKLNLTRVSLLDTPTIFPPINVRQHILSHVGNLPLTSIDLSQNSVVRYEPGLTEFARSLELFYVSSIGIGNFPDHLTAMCSILDIATHPNLKELEFSLPTPQMVQFLHQPDFWEIIPEGIKRCGCNASAICHCLDCICRGVMSFDCGEEPMHTEALIDALMPLRNNCIGRFNIPLPPTLQVFKFRYSEIFMAYKYNLAGLDFCVVPNNGLRHLDVSNNQIGPALSPSNVTSYGMRTLTYLSLQNNQIKFEDYSRFLYNMPSLEVAVLRGNVVSFSTGAPRSDLFRDNPRLQVLDMSACGIRNIPRGELANLFQLREIDVSLNELKTFDLDLRSVHLERLNLSSNSISFVPQSVTDNLDRLTSSGTVITLDLSKNPLICQCPTLDFVQWMQTTKVVFAKKELLTCLTGDAQALLSPFRVDVMSMRYSCMHMYEILEIVLSFVGLLTFTILVYCIYKKRWRLRYWKHTAREAWRRRKATRDATRNGLGTHPYVYDAFVAYSTHGRERSWVHTTLREKLEDEHGLRLCIHYRDFRLGRAIDECIVDAINKSRKTILVLSPEFLNSGWCQFEVRMVKERVIEERRDSFIIVIFRSLDQPGTKVPKDLVRLLERKIYVEWTSDPDGQKLFWSRLVEALCDDVHHDPFQQMSAAHDAALLGPRSDT